MVRDADGEITGWITTREPEFSAADRANLIASVEAEKAPRGAHGLPISETTDPASQYEWEIPLPTLDFAQAKLDAAVAAYKKQYPDADTNALLWRVLRKSGAVGDDQPDPSGD